MALFTTSGDGAGSPTRRRRRLAGVGRAVTWPFRLVWWVLGWLSRGLVASFGALAAAWSWTRPARRFIDAPLAVALFAFAVLGPPGLPYTGMPSTVVTLLLAAQLLPIAVARARPVPAALVMAGANAVGLFTLDYYPVMSIIALVGVIGVVASRVDRTTAAQVGTFASFALLPMLWHPSFQPFTLMWWVGAIVVALAFGHNLRSRREAETGRTVAQRQQALLEERSRIARELHDVVAHHMSLIAVQSQSAPRRIANLPPEGVADFGEINTAARNALAEMRQILAVLRDGRDGTERAPQPGVDALPALISDAEQAGQTVGLHVTGTPRPLRDALDVSVYRIVQEALTNVRRHAGVMAADVSIAYLADVVRVRVSDQGSGDRSTGANAGHGLVGMRERVTMLGGQFSAGDGTDGGFVVDASLPYEPAAGAP